MAEPDSIPDSALPRKQIIELALQLGVLFVLIAWCFQIVRPFITMVVWGVIVAIALYPAFTRLAKVLGSRHKLASSLLVLALISILVLPAIALTDSLVTAAESLAGADELQIPPPPAQIMDWPLIGERLYDTWALLAEDPPAVLGEFAPQLKALGSWLLETVAGTGLGLLQFIVSFVVAGVLMVTADKGARSAAAIASRLAGARGPEFARVSTTTIRNVALGIVGVSIVQTTLLSIAFLAVALPAAGLAALITLVLCIIQVGPGLVVLPAIIYVVSSADTLPAVLFTIWCIAMTFIDSILKPMVFGRGAAVPTLVIFLGSIGGMLAYGIIGLFIGAVVLSVGFQLYQVWLQEPAAPATS